MEIDNKNHFAPQSSADTIRQLQKWHWFPLLSDAYGKQTNYNYNFIQGSFFVFCKQQKAVENNAPSAIVWLCLESKNNHFTVHFKDFFMLNDK